MSKKETRRAARQAFPKAKNAPATKGAYGTRSKSSARGKGSTASRQGTRPPSVKRAVITGAIMGVIYFLLIHLAWPSGASLGVNVIIAVIACVVFAGVVYGVDRFKYTRYLNKQNRSSK